MNHLTGFGMLFTAAGCVAVWGGLERFRRKQAQARRAVATTARITGVASVDGDDGPTWYKPVVVFDVGGTPVRATLLKGTTRRDVYRTGSELAVHYDPADPTQVVARPDDFPGQGMVLILGMVFVIVGGGLLWTGHNGG